MADLSQILLERGATPEAEDSVQEAFRLRTIDDGADFIPAHNKTSELKRIDQRGFLGDVKFFLGESKKAVGRGNLMLRSGFESLKKTYADFALDFMQRTGKAGPEFVFDPKVEVLSPPTKDPFERRRQQQEVRLLENMDRMVETASRKQAFFLDAVQSYEFAESERLIGKSAIPFTADFSMTKMIGLGMSSAPSLALSAMIMGLTRNPGAAGAALGSIEASEEFQTQKDEGVPFKDRASFFVVNTAMLAYLESLPLTKFLEGGKIPKKGFISGVVARGRQATQVALQEGLEEATQQIWIDSIAKIGYDKTRNLTEGLVEQFIAGFISGGVLGGFSPMRMQAIAEAKEAGVDTEAMSEEVGQQAIDNAEAVMDKLQEYQDPGALQEDADNYYKRRIDESEKYGGQGAQRDQTGQIIIPEEQATPQFQETSRAKFREFTDRALRQEIGENIERSNDFDKAKVQLDVVNDFIEFFRNRIDAESSGLPESVIELIPSEFISREADNALEGSNIPGSGVATPSGEAVGMSLSEAVELANESILIDTPIESEMDLVNFLIEAVSERKRLRADIEKLRFKTVTRQEQTILREKIRNVRRGARIGAAQSRNIINQRIREVNALLDESSLDRSDKDKFRKTLRNIASGNVFNEENFQTLLKDIEKRVDALLVTKQARTLRNRIRKELKDTKTRRQSGKKVGKFGDADIQNLLDRAREMTKLTQAEAQELINKSLENAEEKVVGFDTYLENRLLSFFAGLENKNIEELSDLLDTIKTIKDTGRAIKILEDDKRLGREAEMVRESLAAIEGTKPATGERFPGLKQLADKHLRSSYVSIVGWNDKLDILSMDDANSRQDDSYLSRNLNVAEEVKAKKRGVRIYTDEFMREAHRIFGISGNKALFRKFKDDTHKPINLGTFENGFGETVKNWRMTRSEIRKLWMEMQDPSLYDTFFTAEIDESGNKRGMGMTQEMVDRAFLELSEEDVNFAKWQLEFYNKYYDTVNEVYRQIYGVDLPKNDFYSPITRKHGKGDVADAFFKEMQYRRSVGNPSLKERIKNLRPLKPQNDINIFMRHVVEMEHFKAFAFKMRDLNAVFGNERVQDVIQEKFGSGMMTSIFTHLQDFTRGGINQANLSKFWEYLRLRTTVSRLALKPAIAIKQLVSFVAFAEDMPTLDFVNGTTEVLSAYSKRLLFPKEWNEIKSILDSSDVMKDRGYNIDRDLKDIARSKEWTAFRKSPNFFNMLLLNVRWGDRGAIYLGGWSVYKYHRSKGATHEEAIRKFEEKLSSTQQSGDIDQLSDWQRGNSFQKLFSMFSSAQNQYFRREVSALRNLLARRITKKEFAKKFVIYHWILPMFFQWVADAFYWDKENQQRAAIMGSLNGIFILSDMLESGIMIVQGENPFDRENPVFEIGDALANAAGEITNGDILEAIKELSEDVVGPLTGLPIKQIFDAASSVEDFEYGEPGAGALKLMGWSPYVVEQQIYE